jgi:Leucine-rich repeat (LRR) protein
MANGSEDIQEIKIEKVGICKNPECKKKFMSNDYKLKYCSDECRKIIQHIKEKEYRYKNRKNKYCVICSRQLLNTSQGVRLYCNKCLPTNIKFNSTWEKIKYLRNKFPQFHLKLPYGLGATRLIFPRQENEYINKNQEEIISNLSKKILNEDNNFTHCIFARKDGVCTHKYNPYRNVDLCKYHYNMKMCPMLTGEIREAGAHRLRPCSKCGKLIDWNTKNHRNCVAKLE